MGEMTTLAGRCTFCFAKDGKGTDDARRQADRTGDMVLFFDGIFRYALLPGDPTLYDYTTKEDVFDLSRKILRQEIIKKYGVDPDMQISKDAP